MLCKIELEPLTIADVLFGIFNTIRRTRDLGKPPYSSSKAIYLIKGSHPVLQVLKAKIKVVDDIEKVIPINRNIIPSILVDHMM